jgi:hypothetical protein
MLKSTFVNNRFAVFTTMLCAAVRPALFPHPISAIALSGASRRDCASSRHAEAFAQRHTSSHRSSGCRHSSVSQALSTVLRLSTIETCNQLDMFSEKGTANAPSRPR